MASGSTAVRGELSPALGELFYSTIQRLLAELDLSRERREEMLGEAFLACERLAREKPSELHQALEAGRLDRFLTGAVRQSLRPERPESFGGGWMGTFVGPDGRAIEDEWSETPDLNAVATSQKAFNKALSIATSEGDRTMERNLRWYWLRLSHRTYDAIAAEAGSPPATVRTGVARARKRVLRIAHELQEAQPAPLNGESPPEVAPLRRLWEKQDLDALAKGLEKTRGEFGCNPHWLNLAALLTADRGDRLEATRLYEQALVSADAPDIRGRILNNLGNLAEDEGLEQEAVQFWLRAHQLVPQAPTPLLNLLASAAGRRSYPSAQHYLSKVGDLLRSGKLGNEEGEYVRRRLAENPKLRWLRQTEAWRVGAARWIRAGTLPDRARRPRAVAQAVGILIAALLLGAGPAGASSQPALDRSLSAVYEPGAPRLVGTSGTRPESRELRAGGDSMPRTGGDPPRPPRPPRRS